LLKTGYNLVKASNLRCWKVEKRCEGCPSFAAKFLDNKNAEVMTSAPYLVVVTILVRTSLVLPGSILPQVW